MSPNSNPQNPNKNLSIPKWINEEYFTEIIQHDLPNFERIVDFQTIAATAPGENYLSIMIRVAIEVELKDRGRKTISYILKTAIETGNTADFVHSMCLFPREKQMYQVLLKEFEKLYQEAGYHTQLGPKCLRVEETPERITIILEDLRRQNYKNVDRLKGMDLEHTRCVLRKLAELHAASVMYYELNGAYDQMFMKTFFTEENIETFIALAENQREIFVRAIREWDLEDVETYIKYFGNPRKLFEKYISLNRVDPNEFNVLNHGDCWTNNVMFKYKDNGEIDDVLFIDFQVCKWGTPAQDLWYFILISTSYDIRVKEFDQFISIYQKHLKKCLEMFNYPKHIPTLREMHELMLKYGHWGISTASGTLSAALYPSDEEANLENFLNCGPEMDEFKYKVFSNPLYAKTCCQIYPFLKNRGIFGTEIEEI